MRCTSIQSLSQILFCLLAQNLWYLLLRFVLSKVDHKLELNYLKFWAQRERKQTLQHVWQCGANVNEEENRNRIETIFGIWNTVVHMEPRSLAEKIGKLQKKQRLGDCKVKKVICVVQEQSHFSCLKPKSELKRNTEELRNEIIAFNYSCYTPWQRLKTDEVCKMCRFAGKGQLGRSRVHNFNLASINCILNLNLSRSESRNTNRIIR